MTEKDHNIIHIHKTRIKSNFQVFALLIPSIAFVFILALFVRGETHNYASKTPDRVLGDEMPIIKVITVGTKEISVTLADTEAKRQKGLGGTRSLTNDQGMLFIFGEKNYRTFWMKDMLMAIDIIWLSDGKIVQINKNVAPPEPGTPDSGLKLYVSNQEVEYVLETNAGFSDSFGLQIGDPVDLSRVF